MYLVFVSISTEDSQQAIGIVFHDCGTAAKGYVCIIAERHNAGIGNVDREKFLQPEYLVIGVI